MSDEEPVDPKKELEEACKPKCVKSLIDYKFFGLNQSSSYFHDCCRVLNKQKCVERIQGDESGHKHCTGQYFDFWGCIDKCVAPKLFTKLK